MKFIQVHTKLHVVNKRKKTQTVNLKRIELHYMQTYHHHTVLISSSQNWTESTVPCNNSSRTATQT